MKSQIDNVEMIRKILEALEKAMDNSSFSISDISADELGVSEERWGRYIEMMNDTGLIKGVRVFTNAFGELRVEDEGIKITLKGLEYLTYNSAFQRAFRKIKDGSELAYNLAGIITGLKL